MPALASCIICLGILWNSFLDHSVNWNSCRNLFTPVTHQFCFSGSRASRLRFYHLSSDHSRLAYLPISQLVTSRIRSGIGLEYSIPTCNIFMLRRRSNLTQKSSYFDLLIQFGRWLVSNSWTDKRTRPFLSVYSLVLINFLPFLFTLSRCPS